MDKSTALDAVSDSLEAIIELHLQRLTEKVARPCSIDELADEVGSLNDLVASYRRRDELLERLLDISTLETRRQQIRETLQAQRILVAANLAEGERLHARSRELLERSARLILKVQCRIDREAHKASGYALELCGFCKGIGGGSNSQCPACLDEKFVLVHQPSIQCPRCKGDGQPENYDYRKDTCVICRGTGWVMTA